MSLIHWWPLNGNTMDQISTLSLSGTLNSQSGGKVTALYARQHSSQLTISNSQALYGLTSFSIAMWVRLSNTQNSTIWADLFSLNLTKGSVTEPFRVEVTGNGSANFAVFNNNISGVQGASAPFSLIKNQWQHIIIIKNGALITSYVNGIKCGESSLINSANAYTTGEFHIGNEGMYCDYNDVRIYNHCLSPREIQLLAQGLVAHYKLDDPYIESTTNLLNGVWAHTNFWDAPMGAYTSLERQLNGGTCEVVELNNIKCLRFQALSGEQQGRIFSTYTIKANTTYTVSLDYYASSTHSNALKIELYGGDYSWAGSSRSYSTLNQWERLSITITPTSNTTLYIFAYANKGKDAYINNIQLEEKDHATPYTSSNRAGGICYDCSGYGNHGTASGTFDISTNSPRYSHSTGFSGNAANRITNTTTQFYYTDNFTWSCWIKHKYPNAASFAFTVGRADYGPDWGYGLQEISTSSVRLRFGSSDYAVSLDENNWHHLAFTKSGNNISIYVDGVPTNYTFSGTLPAYTNSQGLGIGCFWYSGGALYPFYGRLSDFRIYATALPAAAVKELYQSSISILNNGTLQCSEIVEKDTNIELHQNGCIKAKNFTEIPGIRNMKTMMLPDGSSWARIYYLNLPASDSSDYSSNDCFANFNEAHYCIDQSNRFSLLKYMHKFKNKNNEYEFLLAYPQASTPKALPSYLELLSCIENQNGRNQINTGITTNAKWEFDIQFPDLKRPLIPKMTSNTEPSGTATAYGSYKESELKRAYCAFDGHWRTGADVHYGSLYGLTTKIGYIFPAAQKNINLIKLIGYVDSNGTINSGVIEYTINGSDWSTLVTLTQENFTNNEVCYYHVNVPELQGIRVGAISTSNDGGIIVRELQVYEPYAGKRQLMGYSTSGQEYWGVQAHGGYGIHEDSGLIGRQAGERDLVIHNYGDNDEWYLAVHHDKTQRVRLSNTTGPSERYQIFAMGSTATSSSWGKCSAKLYSCRCIKNGIVGSHYLPAMNTNNGNVGLWDCIQGSTSILSSYTFIPHKKSNIEKNLPSPWQYNRWTQTNNIDAAITATDTYQSLLTGMTSKEDAGLHYGPLTEVTSADWKDDTVYAATQYGWWSPVGQLKRYQGGIPAPNGTIQLETELWVRIDTLGDPELLSFFTDAIQTKEFYEL